MHTSYSALSKEAAEHGLTIERLGGYFGVHRNGYPIAWMMKIGRGRDAYWFAMTNEKAHGNFRGQLWTTADWCMDKAINDL